MSKSKGTRLTITIECTECRKSDTKHLVGVSRYTTTKNRRNTTDRIELKKFCRSCKQHQIHKEIK
jgi:large subunit ribosomal protein L33